MSGVASRAVVRLDERDDVLQQLVVERILGRIRGHHLAARRRPAGRHDDDHRHGLLLGEQVVEDVVGAADGRPRDGGVAAAMNQVEHREAAGALLVSGRRVDVHLAARVAERLCHVADEPDGAVRHVARLGEVARHVEHALHLRLARRDVDVARVDDGHAVDGEGVAPGAGPDGADVVPAQTPFSPLVMVTAGVPPPRPPCAPGAARLRRSARSDRERGCR